METKKLSGKIWSSIIIFGLFGQVAWIVENMYFNVFMYKTVTYNLTATAWMIAASAIVATVTTLFAGVLSDRIGKRKLFISIGYILWGFSVMVFAAISTKNTQAIFPSANAVKLTIVFIILMDCVMTFMGSMANDASFNAWVTDVTNSKNRGKAEGVLAIMPLVAMLVVFGAFDSFTQQGKWMEFFIILGGITSLMGVLGLFLIKDDKGLKPKKSDYMGEIIYGFKLSTIKKNKNLYIVYLAMAILGIANNIYIPYLIIYIQYFLNISSYVIILGIVIVFASMISVVLGFFSDKYDRRKFFVPSLILYISGAIGMFFARQMVFVSITGLLLMSGNLALSAMLSATVRDLTPADKAGLFQGIRMVFYVLLPMCIGPFIGSFISKTSNASIPDGYGGVQLIPSNYIFIGALAIVSLIVIPFIFILKMKKGEMKINDNTKIE